MDQNKFLNAYIENTHAALNEAHQKAIAFSTQKQMLEEQLKDVMSVNVEYEKKIGILNESVQNLTAQNNVLSAQMVDLQNADEEKEHIGTFKTALAEARSRIVELEKQLKKRPEKETVEQ